MKRSLLVPLLFLAFVSTTSAAPTTPHGGAIKPPMAAPSSGVAATASLRPLGHSEIEFLHRVVAENGKLTLRTAAFSFGTGGQQSAPAKRGYVEHHGTGPDTQITISITEAGKAFLASRR